jgi:hypothetical protein
VVDGKTLKEKKLLMYLFWGTVVNIWLRRKKSKQSMGKECASIKTTATGAEQTKTHKINPIQPGRDNKNCWTTKTKEGNSQVSIPSNQKQKTPYFLPFSYFLQSILFLLIRPTTELHCIISNGRICE